MAIFVYFQPNDVIFHKFDSYEIHPCLIVGIAESGEVIYEQCDLESQDIAIWCVYGHFITGGLECISDNLSLEEAEESLKRLPTLQPIVYNR